MKIRLSDKSKIIYKKKIFDSSELDVIKQHVYEIVIEARFTKETVVGVQMEHSPCLLITIMTLLEEGITFVCLDKSLPERRIKYIIADSNVTYIISDNLSDMIYEMRNFYIMGKYNDIEGGFTYGGYNEIAYIIYTSGTTGNPKGVEVTRKALLNFYEGIDESIDISGMSKVASFTNCSFDIFFLETVYFLMKGYTVVLADSNERKNPIKMLEVIQENKIEIIQMTPSHIKMMLLVKPKEVFLSYLRLVLVGGEMLTGELLKKIKECTNAQIYNMYGPTETTIWSSIANLTNSNNINIGLPIKNTFFYIMDENLNQVKNGKIGEICIAGDCLARGYKNNSELTKEKFVFVDYIKKTVYLTGDIGLFDGEKYYCLGRRDNQVKINGYRVELEEIEKIAIECFKLIDGLAYISNKNVLSMLYISKENIEEKEFEKRLSEFLPQCMVPKKYYKVPKFIMNTNGKVSRKDTVEYNLSFVKSIACGDSSNCECNTVEDIVKNIITNRTDGREFELQDSLYDILNDSLVFIEVISEIENYYNFEFDEDVVFSDVAWSLKDIIDYIKNIVGIQK